MSKFIVVSTVRENSRSAARRGAWALLLLFTTALSAGALTDPDTGLTYEVINGTAVITGGTVPADGRLEIPTTLDGIPVTVIGTNAFFASNVVELSAPSVIEIQESALAHSFLQKFFLPSATSLEGSAFYSSGLQDAFLPAATGIAAFAFGVCPDLDDVFLGGTPTAAAAAFGNHEDFNQPKNATIHYYAAYSNHFSSAAFRQTNPHLRFHPVDAPFGDDPADRTADITTSVAADGRLALSCNLPGTNDWSYTVAESADLAVWTASDATNLSTVTSGSGIVQEWRIETTQPAAFYRLEAAATLFD